MAERGYPTHNFEEQADLVSVDHPRVVENYRAAYAVYQRQRDGQASTEDLRDALVRYRSLFEELLHPGDGARSDAAATDARVDGTAAGAADRADGTVTDPALDRDVDLRDRARADVDGTQATYRERP